MVVTLTGAMIMIIIMVLGREGARHLAFVGGETGTHGLLVCDIELEVADEHLDDFLLQRG